LEKDIGFFDARENNASVLTASMAEDTSIVNGASSESLGPITEACFAIFGGIGVGFYLCWQMALICLGAVPLLGFAQFVAISVEKNLANETKDENTEADLLCGDSIINYKTVQSMGHEDKFVEKYRELLQPIQKKSLKSHNRAAIAAGFAQFTVYGIFALLFYVSGRLIEASMNATSGDYAIQPTDVIAAMFAIVFGASAAGQAFSMSTDIGKATVAATNIYRVIEYPSKINAVE